MVQRTLYKLIRGRKMTDLAQIWEDIVDYCQKVFENSHKSQQTTKVFNKPNKVVKKKKTTVKK